jgi:putative FmdB family regulatory protein
VTGVPLVDYSCPSCGATHELFAASPIAETIACPSCGAAAQRRFGLGGLLGVRPARRAKDRLDRERATQAPMDAGARRRLREHQHGHDHHHDHHHSHDHRRTTMEEDP